MSEALSQPEFDVLRNNVPQPAPQPIDARRQRIEQRAAVLIAEEFRRNPPKNAWWGDDEVAIRDRCFQKAQDEIATELGIEAWRPKGMVEDTTDWSVPPRMGLKLAISERRAAAEFRGKAATVAGRASDRLVALELELSQFRDLDHRIDECRLEQARNGDFDRDLPYSLAAALKDRSVCKDRSDHAQKANNQLQSELRAAERALQAKDKVISAWCTRLLLDHADSLADDWKRVQDEADQRKAMLYALTYLTPPHSNGPVDITKKLHEALNATSAPPDHNYQSLKPLVNEWSRAHTALAEDPDASIELA